MAITIDQANLGEFASDTAGTTAAFTTTQNVAVGGFIVLTATCNDSQSISSFSGGGLTWTIDKQGTGLGTSRVAIASAQAPAGLASGTTLTATFSASTGGQRSICGTSFLGVVASAPVDVTDNVGFLSTTAWTTNSITVQNGSVIVVCAGNSTNLFTSTPTSPLIEAHDFGQGTGFCQTVCYRIESAGSYTSAGTWSSTSSGTVNAVAYLAAASTSTAVPPLLLMSPRISI